ncbi:MAG: glycosyl transferase [Candidatus Saccharibacteria bacterium]|nr:glycosyl transferase [Candidatus Saccharibacteria bacterium]
MSFLLHAENFKRIPFTGGVLARALNKRAAEMTTLTHGMTDPDLSVIIRSRNNIFYIKELFEDIQAQDFKGQIEVIVVDTESTDGTVEYSQSQGAKIIHLSQADFTYPVALNLGFNAAKYPYVVTLVGHSNLSNTMMFKSLTFWSQQEKFGGMYGIPLTNKNGSFWDRIDSMLLLTLMAPKVLNGPSGGMLGANTSIVNRSVWEKLGGYDNAYGGGGEDAALARSMLADGYVIVREPLLRLFHSHGLNLINSIRQRIHWIRVGRVKPQAFATHKVRRRRPDLRS